MLVSKNRIPNLKTQLRFLAEIRMLYLSAMNAAIGSSISSKLMVMHYKNFAKFHGRLWEQIDNGY